MNALRKHYVAPAMVDIPVNGDGLMAVASPSKQSLPSNVGSPSVCDFEENNGVEDAENLFSSTSIDNR